MKKTTIAIFLFIVLIPYIGYATQPASSPYAEGGEVSKHAADESQTVIITEPSREQSVVADEDTLSPEVVKTLTTEDNQSINGKEATKAGKAPVFDIPLALNEKVESYLHYFTNRLKEKFSTWLARSERYLPMMKKTFKDKGLPEDLTYLALIESGFNDKAFSRAKAVGQWQFIKGTGKRYGLRIDRWIDERRDPEKATEAAAEYLSDLYGMFNDWYLAAASYNAGEAKISRAINKYDTNDFWQLSQPRRRYLKNETKDYVPKFIAAAMIAKEPAKYGFNDIEYHTSLVYERVTINGMKDLRKIAAVAKCDVDDLKVLNPELKTNFTPPNYRDYQLKVPVGKKATIEDMVVSLENVPEKAALREVGPKDKRYDRKQREIARRKVISYIVREGDTLQEIASKYSVETKHLVKWNRLRGNQLKAGKRLKIHVQKEMNSSKKLS